MWGGSQRFRFTDENAKAQLREGKRLVVLSDLKSFFFPLQVLNTQKPEGSGR